MPRGNRLVITRTLLALAIFPISLPSILLAQTPTQEHRPRARELGIHPGIYEPGPNNAITDVAGVQVGQVTLVKDENVRTGVTAILPHAGNIFQDKVAGAVYVYNAFGNSSDPRRSTSSAKLKRPSSLPTRLASGTPPLRLPV